MFQLFNVHCEAVNVWAKEVITDFLNLRGDSLEETERDFNNNILLRLNFVLNEKNTYRERIKMLQLLVEDVWELEQEVSKGEKAS